MEDIEKAVYLSRDLNKDFEKYMKNKKINIEFNEFKNVQDREK